MGMGLKKTDSNPSSGTKKLCSLSSKSLQNQDVRASIFHLVTFKSFLSYSQLKTIPTNVQDAFLRTLDILSHYHVFNVMQIPIGSSLRRSRTRISLLVSSRSWISVQAGQFQDVNGYLLYCDAIHLIFSLDINSHQYHFSFFLIHLLQRKPYVPIVNGKPVSSTQTEGYHTRLKYTKQGC